MSMLLRPIARAFAVCSSIILALVLLLGLPSSHAEAAATLYMVGGGPGHISGLWTVNITTGAATYVAPLVDVGGDLYLYAGGLAYDSYNHTLYALGQSFLGVSNLYSINPSTGFATVVGPSGPSAYFGTCGLAYDPASHKLYAVGDDVDLSRRALFEINTATGAATFIGVHVANGTILNDVGIDPVSGTLYANGTNDFLQTPSKLFTLDKGSGAETVIGSHGVTLGRQLYYGGIAFHPSTNVCYSIGSITASASGLYTLDTSTGAATLVGDFGLGISSTDGGIAFVPDPTTGVGPLPIGERALAASPNPFSHETTVSYSLDRPGHVQVDVFDIAGRRVATIFRGMQGSGDQRVTWNGKTNHFDAPVGVYFIRVLVDGEKRGVMKLVRLDD